MEEERRLCYVGMTRAEKKSIPLLGPLPAQVRWRATGSLHRISRF